MDYAIDNSYSNTQSKITLSWIGEGWTSSSSYSSTYEQSNAASFAGKVNGTTQLTASLTGSRSATVSSAGFSWKKAGPSSDVIVYITKTTSSQSIPIVVQYTVSGTTHTGTANVTVSAKPSYTVKYNGNGHTGGTVPANQTKWYGTTLTLSSSYPSRTGYTFLGWSTSSSATSATYCTGTNHTTNNTYSSNADLTLYAIWSKTITLSYNQGSITGASNIPANQSVTIYNATTSTPFTISSQTPTLQYYKFTGWNSAVNGSGTYYIAGQSYSLSSNLSLYAQWEEDYIPLKIETAIAYRTDSTGTDNTGSGSYGKLEFTWKAGSLSGTYYDLSNTTVTAKYKAHTSSGWTTLTSPTTTSLGNNKFSYSKVFGGSLSSDIQYDIQFSIQEGNFDAVTYSLYISTEAYVIDVSADGGTIGLLEVAPDTYTKLTSQPSDWTVGWSKYYRGPTAAELFNGMPASTRISLSDLTSAPNFTISNPAYYKKDTGVYAPQLSDDEVDTFINNLSQDFRGTVDWVVAQGTSGEWTYRKWDSGISECWMSHTYTTATATTAWGTLYYGTLTSTLTYPSGLFTAAPQLEVTIQSQGGRFWPSYEPPSTSVTTNVGTIYNLAPQSYTGNNTAVLNLHAYGTWK